ncbi:MAG: response regulator [Bacteroidales bacterium]|nr:response regulator [Bacteroidales bacterium]
MNKDFQILVVEDQEDNYELLQEFLQSLGYTVLLAQNGLEAVEKAKQSKNIDLVLMDIKMPVMEGEESLLELRKIFPELPVIAVTAYAMAGDKERFLKLGFNAYLTKPISLGELKEKILEFQNIN